MRFIDETPGFALAAASAANYPDGLIGNSDGTPAIVIRQAFTDDARLILGRRAALAAMAMGEVAPSTIYHPDAISGGRVDKDQRRSQHMIERTPQIFAVYGLLDRAADEIAKGFVCDYGAMGKDFVSINHRQQLIYQSGDHFEHPTGLGGHADDSVFREGRWVRNDPRRHMVGLIYLTDGVESITNPRYQFTGGQIEFPFVMQENARLSITPKAGLMVFFPANPLYLHLVKKVAAGTRIAFATWYSFNSYR